MHKYLGMKLDYRKQGKVKINTTDNLNKIMEDMPNKYQGMAITPAENHIFEVNKTTRKLNNKDAQSFRTIVAKLIFLCKRARTDILTGVAFLTTRMRSRRRRRQETIADTKISHWHEDSHTHPGIRHDPNSAMVGGRGIHGAPLHEEPHGQDDFNGTRRPVLHVEQNKTEHKDLNRSGSGGSG